MFCDLGGMNFQNIHASLFIRKWYLWNERVSTSCIGDVKKDKLHDEKEKIRYRVQIPKLVSRVKVDPGNEAEGFRENHKFCRL